MKKINPLFLFEIIQDGKLLQISKMFIYFFMSVYEEFKSREIERLITSSCCSKVKYIN